MQTATKHEEASQSRKSAQSCVLVIFGATGDLTSRKLIPALYNLACDHQLPENFACVAFARRDKTNEVFREEMLEAVQQFSRTQPIDME
ncbi:MAG: glucose-6-phosphate dehydrogenase, partial [Parachlamydiaceae bacterium]|nr:glucose-6-phosphate dehydrogenase [Parachlamydiaceae bacterium]